jgi:hypothetical protein
VVARAALLSLALCVVAVLALSGTASAQDPFRPDPVPEAGGAQLPVSLGQPGARSVDGGLIEVGLAVPVLLSFTAILLCVGAGMLWHRCRLQAVAVTGESNPG